MIKHFHIFRHGQTDMNLKMIYQGSGVNSPLNNIGRQQARDIAQILKDKGIEVIYSSPLVRALETAQIVNETINVNIVNEHSLREAGLGQAEGKPKDIIADAFPEEYSLWKSLDESSLDACFPEGETKRQVQERMLDILNRLSKDSAHNIIGLSTHSGMIRYLLWYFGNYTNDVPNCGCYHVVYENGKLKLVG